MSACRCLSRVPCPLLSLYQVDSASRVFINHVRELKKFRRSEDPLEMASKPVFQYASNKTTSKIIRRSRVYAWGLSITGALGAPKLVQPNIPDGHKPRPPREHFIRPYKLNYFTGFKVKDVAAGYGFSLIASSTIENPAKVFGTGLNTNYQLGHQVTHEGNQKLEMLTRPAPIQLPIHSSVHVIKVAAGRSHSLFLTDRNELFSLGSNSFGQCGRKIIENEDYFRSSQVANKIILPDDNEMIEDIICGQDHSIVLTKSGKLYAFGMGTDGQTGLGSFTNTGYPERIKGDLESEKIIHVSSAADSCLAVSGMSQVHASRHE